MPAVLDLSPEQTPYCVVDLETTGLSPGLDRVVELTAIRLDPGCEPQLVLDTLVHPERPMAATELHGISDQDVQGAPSFSKLAPELLEALSGAILVSYNVYFDLRFLTFEVERSGYEFDAPHMCAMYMRPLLGVGKRCPLRVACEESGVEHVGVHTSAGDAIATAELMQGYLQTLRSRGWTTFAEVARKRRYKFLKSWSSELVNFPAAPVQVPKKSRLLEELGLTSEEQRRWRLREYQDTVLVFLDDFEVSTEEAEYAAFLRDQLQITQDEVRAVHARIFAAALNQWAADDRIDAAEAQCLRKLAQGLERLGWRPG